MDLEKTPTMSEVDARKFPRCIPENDYENFYTFDEVTKSLYLTNKTPVSRTLKSGRAFRELAIKSTVERPRCDVTAGGNTRPRWSLACEYTNMCSRLGGASRLTVEVAPKSILEEQQMMIDQLRRRWYCRNYYLV